MTDEKSPVEQALDLLLYAPVGLVFSARELLPKLAEKGRTQLGMAKMIGQFAVQQGQTEAGKVLGQAQKQAISTLEQLAGRPTPASSSVASRNGAASNGAAPKPVPAIDVEVVNTPPVPTSGPEAATLAITDYDSLSASQVLPRLTGLSADELEAVRAYESAHRGRKTILNRAAQLQS